MFVLFPGSISREGAGAPSPELLASLQSLRDNVDSTLLPHSLHQVCKGGSFPCPSVLKGSCHAGTRDL